MKKAAIYYTQQKKVRISATKEFSNLVQLKKEGDRSAFNELLLKILPEVKKFVNYRLENAIHKGHFSKGKYKAEDVIDQLFIEVYENIEDIKSENDFYKWLFIKTSKLLEDIIVEEEFDDLFYENIDDFTKTEWDEMHEKLSADLEGNLIMTDELDDISYNHNNTALNRFFVTDNEKELLMKIDEKISEEQILHQINVAVRDLPIPMQDVFDLFINQYFTLEEIAEIRNCNVNEVEQSLKYIRKVLNQTL